MKERGGERGEATELMSPSDVADALTEILPVGSAERLGAHLPPSDVATLRDLVRAAVPQNTLRAVASDLAYLEAWHVASTGFYMAWPPSDATALSFIAHHLFRPSERAAQGEAYGMPKDVEVQLRAGGVLRGELPHAPATVSRRLSSWRRVAQARGAEAPLSSAVLRRALSAAIKASDRPKGRHSQTAVTRKVLDRLIGDAAPVPKEVLSLRELRDRTLLLVAFGTGGRRRSELGALRIEHIFPLRSEADLPSPGSAAQTSGSVATDGLGISVGRTKTTNPQDGEHLVVTGRAKVYLDAWLAALKTVRPDIENGPIFRTIDRWNNVGDRGLSGEAVNAIVKRAAAATGLDPDTISAHGLRAGYLTEASLQGVPIEAAMRHSLHRSVQSAVRYYRDEERASGKAAKLAG